MEAAVVKPETRVCLRVQLPLPPHRGRFQPQPTHTPSAQRSHTFTLTAVYTLTAHVPVAVSLSFTPGGPGRLCALCSHLCLTPPHRTALLMARNCASGPEGKQSDRRGEGRGWAGAVPGRLPGPPSPLPVHGLRSPGWPPQAVASALRIKIYWDLLQFDCFWLNIVA